MHVSSTISLDPAFTQEIVKNFETKAHQAIATPARHRLSRIVFSMVQMSPIVFDARGSVGFLRFSGLRKVLWSSGSSALVRLVRGLYTLR